MIEESLFMQTRVFRMFLERFNLAPEVGNRIFEQGGIWSFIDSRYDSLHLSGDEAALEDVLAVLSARGVAW